MTAGQLSLLALVAESLLAVGAVIWIRWRAIPFSWTGEPWPLAVLAGLGAAGALAAVNLAVVVSRTRPGGRALHPTPLS